MRSLFVLVALSLGGCTGTSSENKNFDDLYTVSRGLTQTADGQGFKCVSAEEAMAMSMPLKRRIDGLAMPLREAYLKNPEGFAKEHGFADCASRCSCEGLTYLLDAALSDAHRAQLGQQDKNCLEKAQWFCDSDLLKELRQEAQANAQ